jgi:hypothetical protein
MKITLFNFFLFCPSLRDSVDVGVFNGFYVVF